MWNTGASGSGSGTKEAFIREGNLDFLVITEEKHRITPLTKAVDVEQIMSQNQMTREQAMEYIYTVLAEQQWINPKAYWEHSVPSIPNVRFFSTIPCQGRQTCTCCAENGTAEAQGITENKLKPFPVRKKFIIPIWSYVLNRVMFIRQNEDFINMMGGYINQNGDAIEFDVWRTGKGFQTQYHSMYIGPRTIQIPENIQLIMPNQIDLKISDEEIAKRIGHKSAGVQGQPIQGQPPVQQYNANPGSQVNNPPGQQAPPPTQQFGGQVNQSTHPQTMGDGIATGNFVMPFGNYKNQSIESIFQSGDIDYLKFLAQQSSGLVQEKVKKFLEEKGIA